MDSSHPASQEILKEIVTQYGKQIFNKSESARLDGMLTDYFAHDRKTLKLFRLAVKEYVAHNLLQCDSSDQAEQTIKINMLKSRFRDENMIEEFFVNQAVDSFAYALGWIINFENQTTSKAESRNNTKQEPDSIHIQPFIPKKAIPDVNHKDKLGNTKLHDAIFNNDITGVQNLLFASANVNIKNKNGESPLYIAVFQNNELIVDLLLQAGADMDSKEKNGYTPLICAAKNGYLAVAKLLILKDANINKQDNDRKSAMRWAKDMKNKEIVNLFNVTNFGKKRKLDNPEIEMINIRGGTFTMSVAYPYNNAKREVVISDFSISKNLVSQAKWKEIMNTTPSFYKDDSFPVEQVSYENIQDFIAQLNEKTGKKYRLPTEAEWEYAAKFKQNIIFCDLSEWCNDWFEEMKPPSFLKKMFGSNTSQYNPTGPPDGTQKLCRTKDWRSGYDLKHKYKNLGFRLACNKK